MCQGLKEAREKRRWVMPKRALSPSRWWRKLNELQRRYLQTEGFDPRRRGSGPRVLSFARQFEGNFGLRFKPNEMGRLLFEARRLKDTDQRFDWKKEELPEEVKEFLAAQPVGTYTYGDIKPIRRLALIVEERFNIRPALSAVIQFLILEKVNLPENLVNFIAESGVQGNRRKDAKRLAEEFAIKFQIRFSWEVIRAYLRTQQSKRLSLKDLGPFPHRGKNGCRR